MFPFVEGNDDYNFEVILDKRAAFVSAIQWYRIQESSGIVEFIEWLKNQLKRKRGGNDFIFDDGEFQLWDDNKEAFNRYNVLNPLQVYELWLFSKNNEPKA